jgi:hypothetical protein
MPLFDKQPPRRTLWDRILYATAAVAIWAAVLYCALG